MQDADGTLLREDLVDQLIVDIDATREGASKISLSCSNVGDSSR